MNYREFCPASLAPYVKCFWSLEQERLDSVRPPEPIVPDGCIEIIFNLADRFQRFHDDGTIELQPMAIVTGQMRRSVQIGPTGGVRLFGIRFRPAGAHAFFEFPLFEIVDRIEPLEAIWGEEFSYIFEKLAAAETFENARAVMESELLKVIRHRRSMKIVAAAVREIERTGGTGAMGSLASHLGLSGRQLERHFKEAVGLSPKMYSRIVRFQNLLRALEAGRGNDLLDTSLTYGYFDQSHMIREFKQFAGTSPLNFFAEDHRMSELFTGTV